MFIIFCTNDATYYMGEIGDEWSPRIADAAPFRKYTEAHKLIREMDPECILGLTVRIRR